MDREFNTESLMQWFAFYAKQTITGAEARAPGQDIRNQDALDVTQL